MYLQIIHARPQKRSAKYRAEKGISCKAEEDDQGIYTNYPISHEV